MRMRQKMIAIFAALVCAADMTAAALSAPQWISGDSADPAKPAPMLLKEFSLGAKPAKAVFSVAVAGWCEVYVNGTKAGNDVLSPVTCQPVTPRPISPRTRSRPSTSPWRTC